MDISILTEFGTKTYDLADLPPDVMETLGIPVDDPFERLFPPGLLAPSVKVAPLSCVNGDGFIDREALTLMWRKAVAQKKRRYAMLVQPSPTSQVELLKVLTSPDSLWPTGAPEKDDDQSSQGPTDAQNTVPLSYAEPLAAPPTPSQPSTGPSTSQPTWSFFDTLENFPDARGHPETQIRYAKVALGAAFDELKPQDQAATGIFVKAQLSILNELQINLPPQFTGEKAWLAAVVVDFIRPLANSLDERARGLPIGNAGWADYFNRLDSGKFNYLLPGLSELESAKAMALNHIDNDLRNALEKNGVGSDELWNYLGELVRAQTDEVLKSNLTEDAMKAASLFDPDDDASKIRNRMREKVEASKRKSK